MGCRGGGSSCSPRKAQAGLARVERNLHTTEGGRKKKGGMKFHRNTGNSAPRGKFKSGVSVRSGGKKKKRALEAPKKRSIALVEERDGLFRRNRRRRREGEKTPRNHADIGKKAISCPCTVKGRGKNGWGERRGEKGAASLGNGCGGSLLPRGDAAHCEEKRGKKERDIERAQGAKREPEAASAIANKACGRGEKEASFQVAQMGKESPHTREAFRPGGKEKGKKRGK